MASPAVEGHCGEAQDARIAPCSASRRRRLMKIRVAGGDGTFPASNSARILRRGSVALRPLSFRLCTELIDYHYRPMMRALLLVCLLLLAGCGVPRVPGITPYKPEIQQGNFVSQEQIAQVKA